MGLSGEHRYRSKTSKERVTVALTSNADGSDKRRPLLLHQVAQPNDLNYINRDNTMSMRPGDANDVLFTWLRELNLDVYVRIRILVSISCVLDQSYRLLQAAVHIDGYRNDAHV